MAKKYPGGLITSGTQYPSDGGMWNTGDTAKYTGTDTWSTNDPNRKSVIVTVQGDATAPTHINDSSSYALTVTPNGSARPDINYPFFPSSGYNYPAYFNGVNSSITSAANATFATGVNDFTAECWIYVTALGTSGNTIASTTIGNSNAGWHWYASNTNGMGIRSYTVNINLPPASGPGSVGNVPTNRWVHVAYTRRANVHACWMDGVLTNSTTNTVNYTDNVMTIGNSSVGQYFTGYINNFRFVNGVALYGASLPTTLTANVAGTSLLLNVASGATYITDSSANAFTVLNPATYPITYSALTPLDTGGSLVTANLVYQQLFTSNATWVCPPGVTSVSAVAVGAGGGGTAGWSGYNGINGGAGGGGGGLGWRNNISVTPGQSYTVVVGSGGQGGLDALSAGGASTGTSGGDSYFINRTTVLGIGGGGAVNNTGGGGGSFLGDGGGIGGTGGSVAPSFNDAGGGGAGGYTGAGGNGMYANPPTQATTAGSGGGGAGGIGLNPGGPYYAEGTGGGGVGVLGQGTSGGSPTAYNVEPSGGSYDYAPGGALFFNGTSSYLSAPSNTGFQFGTGDFTVECWFNPISIPAYSPMLISRWDVNLGRTFILSFNATSISWTTGAGTATGGDNTLSVTGVTITAGQWYHIAVTRTSTTQYVFLNGAQVGTNSSSVNMTGTAVLKIGNYDAANMNYFPGYITNVRIVKGVAVYTGAFTPPTAPLTATQTGNPILNIQAIASSTSLLLLSANSAAYITDSSATANTITNTGVIYRLATPFGTGSTGGSNGWASGIPGGVTALGYNPGGDFGGGGGGFSSGGGPTTTYAGAGGRGAVRIIWGSGRSFPNTLTTDQSQNIQYLQVANNAAFQVGSGDFAVDLWIYPTALAGQQRVFSISNSTITTNADEGIVLEINGSAMTASIYSGVTAYTITESAGVISTNTWYYYQLVRTGTTLSLYRNAGLSSSVAVSTVSVNWSSSFQTYIGAWINGPSRAFIGYVTNIRVVKGTLAIVTGNFIPSTVPLTATQAFNVNGTPSAAITAGQTGLLTFQNSTFVDNSGNNLALTNTTTAIKPTAARAPFVSTLSLGATDATLGSTYFNGSTDYLTVADGPEVNVGTLDFTVEAWCWTSLLTPNAAIVAKRGTTSAFSGYQLAFSSSLAPVFNASTDGAAWTVTATSGTSIQPGLWNHVAATRAGNIWSVWVNGKLGATTTVAGNVHTNVAPLSIGSGAGTTPGLYWTGYISNFRKVLGTAVYSPVFTAPTTTLTAVTNTQVLLAVASSGAYITDSSSNNFSATVTGTVTYNSGTPLSSGGSLFFDNTTISYLTLPSSTAFNLTGDFTIEAWIRPTVILAGSNGIIDARASGGTAAPWLFHVDGTGKLAFYNSGTSYTGASTIATNVWTHVAAVRIGSLFLLYVNGVPDYSNSAFGTAAISPGTTSAVIGTKDFAVNAQYRTISYITNLRFVNGTGVYSTFTPPTTSLAKTQSSGTNISSVGQPTVGNYSVLLNGANQYLTVPNNAAYAFGSGDFTVESWIYVTNTASAAYANATIVSMWTTAGGKAFQMRTMNGNVRVDWNGNVFQSSASNVIVANTWNHVAWVKTVANSNVYINGSLTSSVTAPATITASTALLSVGFNLDGLGSTYYFPGYISNLRMVKGVAVYTSNFTPATSSLGTTQVVNQSGTPSAAISGSSTTSYSYVFNGTNYLTVPASAQFDFSSNDFTIEAWVYLASVNTAQSIISTYPSGFVSPGTSYEFLITSTNFLQFDTFVGSSNQTLTATNNAFAVQKWYHVAVARYNGNFGLYVNGVACATSGSISQAVNSGGYTIAIGRSLYTPYNHPMNGYISSLRVTKLTAVYTTSFTPATQPLPSTQVANQYGSPSSAISAVVGYSGFFNGGQYLTMSSGSFGFGTSSFTIEAWVYPSATNSGTFVGSWQQLVVPGDHGMYFSFGRTTASCFSFFHQQQNGTNTTVTSSAYPYNNWYHVAIVRSGNTFTLYVNGIADGSSSYGGSFSETQIWLGVNSPSYLSNYFSGYLNNVRIVNAAVYTGTFSIPTGDLSRIQSSSANVISLSGTETSLLTVQGLTFVDASVSGLSITNSGTTTNILTPFLVPRYYSGSFNGTSQYLTVANNAALQFGTGDFTIEYWVYFLTAPGATSQFPLSKWAANTGWELYYSGSAGGSNKFTFYALAGTPYLAGTTTPIVNTWYHVAVSRASGTIRLFVNGTQEGTPITGNTTDFNDTNTLYIGKENNTTNIYFNGYLSNLRLVKGIAVYTGNFTPSTVQLRVVQPSGSNIAAITSTSATSLLTLQNATIVDNSTNKFTITNTGTVAVSTNSAQLPQSVILLTAQSISVVDNSTVPFTITNVGTVTPVLTNPFTSYTVLLTAKSRTVVDTSVVAATVTNNGVVAPSVNNPFATYAGTSLLTSQYNLPSNNTYFVDSTFNNALTTRAGTAVTGTTNFFLTGTSYHFNGSADYYTTGSAIDWAFLNNGLEDWTVRFWVYTQNTSLSVPLSTTNVAGQTGISIEINNTTYGGIVGSVSVIFFNATGSSLTNPAFNSTAALTANQWNYVAITFAASTKTVSFYINGASAGSSSNPSFVYSTTAPTNTLNIGRNPAGTVYFFGYLSNLQIDKGIQTVLLPNSQLAAVAGAGTYSVLFNGSTSYLTTSVLATRLLTSDYTVEAWIYPTAAATGTTYATSVNILGANSGVTSYQTWGITNAGYIVAARDGLSYQTVTATTPSLNTWTHIAFVNRSNTVTVYLAGNSVGTITQTGTWGITATNTIIGGWGGTGGKFTGHISNLRIINGQGLYTANFTPSSSALSSTALNYSYLFSASYLITPNDSSLQMGTGDFTIESWIYYTTTTGPTYFIGTGSDSGSYRIGVNNATGAVLFYTVNSTLLITTPNTIAINTWAHVAVTRSGGITTVYVNGQSSASATDTANYSSGTTAFGSWTATTTSSWAGYLTNLRITKSAAVYRSNSFTVPTGPLISITQPTTPYSTYLNGSTYITATSSNFVMGTGDFTAECWAWIDPASDSLAGIVTSTTQTTSGFLLARDGAAVVNAAGLGADYIPWTLPTSGWVHIAMSRQSTRLYAFINGVASNSIASTYSNASNTIKLGSRFADSNDRTFVGYITNVRVTSGVALYTSGFAAPTSSFAATANTVLLTAQSAAVADNSGTGVVAITATGTPAYSSGITPFGTTSILLAGLGPYASYTINSFGTVNITTQINPFGTGITALLTAGSATIVDTGYNVYSIVNNAATVSTASPFAAGTSLLTFQNYYLVDNSVYARTITRSGGPTFENFSPYAPGGSWSNSKYGGLMSFNGTSDYVSVPVNAFIIGFANFTLECMIFSTGALTSAPQLIDNFIAASASYQNGQWQFGFSASGFLQFGYATGVSTAVYITGTTALLTNQGYHVAVVRSGLGTNQTTIYVNGAVYAQGTISAALGVAGSTTGGSIGRQTATNTLFLSGFIGQVRFTVGTAVYTAAFTPPTAPLTTLANTSLMMGTVSSAIYDGSSRSQIIAQGSAQVVNSVYKYGSGSMYFNGSTNYLSIPYSDNKFWFSSLADFTIEFWLYATALPGTTAGLYDSRPASTNGAYPFIYLSSDGSIRYYVSTADRITSGASTIAINSWYHIAVVRSSNVTTLYINGAPTGSTYADTTAYISAASVLVGASYAGGASITNYFTGYIDDLRVTKSVARYISAFTPPGKIVS